MQSSPSPAPLSSISKSEYYSSLPWFRRWLAMLNWRPVVDYELREIEFDRREIEYKQRLQQLQNESDQLRNGEQQRKTEAEQRRIAHEQRMRQLDDEDAAFNARMQSLDAKLDALWPSSNLSTTQTQPPEGDSVTSSP